tara:strand:+ start:2207 stop:2989 length:783 start_codon:yes stop_codon:yes gene_type:complete
MKVKISHEVPICLLEDSLEFNDYQYCLPHLLDQDEDYRNFFYKVKREGVYIIMDNSLHELGQAYDKSRLLYWINELKPNEFIVPDVWQNMSGSIVNAREWVNIKLPECVTKVAVVQATNITDAAVCYQTYKDLGYKKIAFSYGAEYYLNHSNHHNKNIAKSLGRIEVVSKMYSMELIKPTDRIHLLGCQVPQEFSWYKDMPFIETIDTSNPIMATLDGMQYGHNGLTEKPKSNMNDNFYTTDIDYNLLDWNLRMFKKLLK